jgi:hypothetical protein
MTEDETNKKEYISVVPFWASDPNVLFRPEYLTELFPSEDMSLSRKMNAVTRMVIYITLLLFIYTRNIRTIIVSALTVGAIFLMYRQKSGQSTMEKFGGSKVVRDSLAEQDISIPDDVFDQPSPENPFSNVMMNDYDFNVNKKPAPPMYNKEVSESVLSQAKQLVRESNPGNPDIADKLFNDLGEQYAFERSMQPFYSMPNTTIPNDQKGFAEFCFGSMISCKEGNQFACARNLERHTN